MTTASRRPQLHTTYNYMTLPGEFTIRQYRQYSASTSTLDLHHHLYSACLLRVFTPRSAFRVPRLLRVCVPRVPPISATSEGKNLRRAPCLSGAGIGFTALICVIVLQGLTNCRNHWYHVTLLERPFQIRSPRYFSIFDIMLNILALLLLLINDNKVRMTFKGHR